MKRSAPGALACFATKKPRKESPEQDERKTHQSSATATPAVDRVLNNTELVEQILLDLDLHDLNKAIRTNPFFRNVAFGSTKIKQAMFLLPDTQPPQQYLVDSSEGEITAIDPKSTSIARNVHQTLLTAHLLNPVLKLDKTKLTDEPHVCSYLELEEKITYGKHILLPYHAHVESNLRDMLIFQPPVSKVSFTAIPHPDRPVIDVDVANDEGVRIGDLVQEVMHTGMVGDVQFVAGYLRVSRIAVTTPQELGGLARMEGKCCPMGEKFMREVSTRNDTQ
ncbi:hypothetical protein AC578_6574 [Pseudocercospora eumusae]|uniref:Uncharacterized protein n=1 Tax=Pseudocercospora eumusae TaxID=321146 RepID=A0A139HHY5_9PEZI|nr:hypothetical protein AC578_6574 [Pseudocercospora eumusae]